ncbi:MAG: hypothetical protein ABI480_14955 [Chitinophagaceae bacterium]
MKTSIKARVTAVALATIFTVGFTSAALANDGKNVIPVELKYLGKFKNQPLFELNFTNADESEFVVIIRDQDGTVLYKDNVKGGSISKKFLLNTEELGSVDLQMEIIGKKTDKTVVFAINQNSRVVEDVVVNKVK